MLGEILKPVGVSCSKCKSTNVVYIEKPNRIRIRCLDCDNETKGFPTRKDALMNWKELNNKKGTK